MKIATKIFGLTDFFAHVEGKLVVSADGIGSKIQDLEKYKKFVDMGKDLVAVLVNDVICVGARPTIMLDYIKVPPPRLWKVQPHIPLEAIFNGMKQAAYECGVRVVGGETAMHGGELDISGTAMGTLILNEPIRGQWVEPGDILVGIESSGLHCNGFTEARGIFGEIPEKYLVPTFNYSNVICELVEKYKNEIHGLVHITGGGWHNLRRLWTDCKVDIRHLPSTNRLVFKELMILSNLKMETLALTMNLNMGIGFVVVIPSGLEESVKKRIRSYGFEPVFLGRVT